MKSYDLVVIGNGSGGTVLETAAKHGMKCALIDEGEPGGTCMNYGCVPSKMLIFPADRIMEILEAGRIGIEAGIKSIDFKFIMDRMRKKRENSRKMISRGLAETTDFDFYHGRAFFADEYVLEVEGERIKGERIVIATGSRTIIPPIKGLGEVDYLTSDELLELQEKPESMIIIGGGYIAVELGHFLSAVGVDVTIVEMLDRIVSTEEPEISALLGKEMGRRMSVNTGVKVTGVFKEDGMIKVLGETKDGEENEFKAEKVLVAVGRRSNADILKTENTGVETDEKGFIVADESLRTSKKNIWALGDATGKHMFKHVANREAIIVGRNIAHGTEEKMDYSVIPRAIFSWPEIASFGMKEEEARKDRRVLIGRAKYSSVALGDAMAEDRGFSKAIVDMESGKILGYHIIGPYASILVQEIASAAAMGLDAGQVIQPLHIHPALSELAIRPFYNLREPDDRF